MISRALSRQDQTALKRQYHIDIAKSTSLYCEESGQGGQAIVFIPGWTMTTAVFEHQHSYFADSENYRVITYDPRSHGLSTKTETGNTYEQHGRDLDLLIKKLGLENVILAGWSFGVLAAFTYLEQFRSTNIKAFINIDCAAKASGLDNTNEWVWYNYNDSDGMKRWFTMGSLENRQIFNREFAEWMLEDINEENIAWIEQMAINTPGTTAALLNETASYLDFEDMLRNLDAVLPMLFVVREEWRTLAGDWHKNNTPNAKLEVMGKHLMFWERHREFNHLLDSFISGLR